MTKAAPGNFTGAGRAGDSMLNYSLRALTRRLARCPGGKSANHLSAVLIAFTSLALNLTAANVGLVDAGSPGSDLETSMVRANVTGWHCAGLCLWCSKNKEQNITLILQNILRDSEIPVPFVLKAKPE